MSTRRSGLFVTALGAAVIGIGGAAWACVPGHDHGAETGSTQGAMEAPAAPVMPVATAQESSTAVQPTATTAAPAASATAPAPTPTATRTATPTLTATAPAAAAPAAATPEAAPAASVTPTPEAAPAVTPTTAFVETVYAEVPASTSDSEGGSALGPVLGGLGVALLAAGVGVGALRWRRDVSPPAVTE